MREKVKRLIFRQALRNAIPLIAEVLWRMPKIRWDLFLSCKSGLAKLFLTHE
jgi:hypothetical protein